MIASFRRKGRRTLQSKIVGMSIASAEGSDSAEQNHRRAVLVVLTEKIAEHVEKAIDLHRDGSPIKPRVAVTQQQIFQLGIAETHVVNISKGHYVTNGDGRKDCPSNVAKVVGSPAESAKENQERKFNQEEDCVVKYGNDKRGCNPIAKPVQYVVSQRFDASFDINHAVHILSCPLPQGCCYQHQDCCE